MTYITALKKGQYQEIKGWQLMYKGEMSLFIPNNSQQHYLSVFLHYMVGLCLPSTSPADHTHITQNKGEWCLARLLSYYCDLQKYQPSTPQRWTSRDQSVKWSQSKSEQRIALNQPYSSFPTAIPESLYCDYFGKSKMFSVTVVWQKVLVTDTPIYRLWSK